MLQTDEYNRIRWHSRRGMLELDLVLLPFVENVYPTLGEADQQRYVKLLTSEDQDMFAWFIRREAPQDPELAAIVQQILRYAETPPAER